MADLSMTQSAVCVCVNGMKIYSLLIVYTIVFVVLKLLMMISSILLNESEYFHHILAGTYINVPDISHSGFQV